MVDRIERPMKCLASDQRTRMRLERSVAPVFSFWSGGDRRSGLCSVGKRDDNSGRDRVDCPNPLVPARLPLLKPNVLRPPGSRGGAPGRRRRFRCGTMEHDGDASASRRRGLLFSARRHCFSPRQRGGESSTPVSQADADGFPRFDRRSASGGASSVLDPGWGRVRGASPSSLAPSIGVAAHFAQPIEPRRAGPAERWRRQNSAIDLGYFSRPVPVRSSRSLPPLIALP